MDIEPKPLKPDFAPEFSDIPSFIEFCRGKPGDFLLASQSGPISKAGPRLRVSLMLNTGEVTASWAAVFDRLTYSPFDARNAAEDLIDKIMDPPEKKTEDAEIFSDIATGLGWDWVGPADFVAAVRQERRLPVVVMADIPIFQHGKAYPAAVVVEKGSEGGVRVRPWRMHETIERAFDEACAEISAALNLSCLFGNV